MRIPSVSRGLALALLALLSAGAAGQAPPRVLSGGVGLESREEMQRVYGDYNLHLGFAAKEGAFLANVEVRIEDSKGQVLWSGPSQGPFLYARLPPGRYGVTAQYSGQPIRRTVQVGDKAGPVQYLRW